MHIIANGEPSRPPEYELNVYSSAKTPIPANTQTASWSGIVDFITEGVEREADKKINLPAFGAHALSKPHRKDENVTAVTLLAIDVDKVDLEKLYDRLEELQISALIYESPSSTEELPRVRVIAAPSRPIAPSECTQTRLAFAELLNLEPGCGVEEAIDPARLYFVGRIEGTSERWVHAWKGALVDVDALASRKLKHSWGKAEPASKTGPVSKGVEPTPANAPSSARVARLRDVLLSVLPPAGQPFGRHELARALGGWLAGNGWSNVDIDALVRSLPSSDPLQRAKQSLEAADRKRRGELTPGWTHLTERFDAEFCSKLERAAKISRNETRAAADQANARAVASGETEAGCDARVDYAISKLTNPKLNLYTRANRLVQVVPASGELCEIQDLKYGRLEEILGVTLEDTGLARSITNYVFARGSYPALRRLEGIADFPALKPDGSIALKSGYDSATRTYFEIDPKLASEIVVGQSLTDAQRALSTLFELVCDFPFASAAGSAAWVAMLLTPLARPAIAGPTPLGLIEASTSSSGKTLLADLIFKVVQGAALNTRTAPSTNEEWAKTMLSILRSGAPIVLFDNVQQMVKSDALDQVLTGVRFSSRVLGASEDITVAVRTSFLLTANNAKISTDLVRRSVCCRLEPLDERPEFRNNFKHPELIEHTKEHRAKYLSAALTILHAYAKAGRPGVNGRAMGSYSAWSRVVRDAIIWAGGEDCATTQDDLRESADVETDEQGAFLAAWHGALGSKPVTVSDVVDKTRVDERLRVALEDLLPTNETSRTKALGNRLRRMRGKRISSYHLDSGKKDRVGSVRWVVTLATAPAPIAATPTPAPAPIADVKAPAPRPTPTKPKAPAPKPSPIVAASAPTKPATPITKAKAPRPAPRQFTRRPKPVHITQSRRKEA